MNIEEFTLDDYPQVMKLWIDCGLIENVEQASIEQLLAFCERGTFLVAKDNSRGVIGTVMGAWDGWRGWIYKLAVAEGYRRKGIGTRLLNEVSSRLRNTGVTIIRAYIEEGNVASLSVFEKLGYQKMDGFVIVTQGRQ